MNSTRIFLMLAMNVVGTILFVYLLYVIGSIAKNVKKLLQKVEELEQTLSTK